MSATNELTRAILFYLAHRGAFVWRNSTGAFRKDDGRLYRFGMVGSSDILGILGDGRMCAIEVKTGRDKLRPAQEQFLDEIRCRGGIALVVRPDDWMDVLEAALDTSRGVAGRSVAVEGI
jgi:hypothetical protein